MDGPASAAVEVIARTPPVRPARRAVAAHRRPSASVLVEAFDAGPRALLAGPMKDARARAMGLLGRLHGRARLFVISAVVVTVLTTVAVLLLSGRSGSAEPSSEQSPAEASVTAAQMPSPSPTASGALAGDDPVAAASELLAQRDACLRLADPDRDGCLTAVADGSTAALGQPVHALAGLRPSLIERSGGSALIALTPTTPDTAPASALLMRTEAGWRLRQLYEN